MYLKGLIGIWRCDWDGGDWMRFRSRRALEQVGKGGRYRYNGRGRGWKSSAVGEGEREGDRILVAGVAGIHVSSCIFFTCWF